ncbi:MAG TPA: hypothetical protein VHS28_01645, partial [Chloroflexota bacterium]|nr:hypothetical protein [Chloroflexota bacterium]
MWRPVGPAVIALIAVLVIGGSAAAQDKPAFCQGFKALADQIPAVAGEPVEDERWGANGDSLQQTTTGLMVWRKADNWTAFTDGVTTWVNGPEGVLDRPNDVRFDWEKESAAAPPQPSTTTASAPVSAPQVFTPEVKPMDSESGGPGGTVKRLMSEVESDWGQTWGWRPSKPTTVYLFTGGYHMAAGLPG